MNTNEKQAADELNQVRNGQCESCAGFYSFAWEVQTFLSRQFGETHEGSDPQLDMLMETSVAICKSLAPVDPLDSRRVDETCACSEKDAAVCKSMPQHQPDYCRVKNEAAKEEVEAVKPGGRGSNRCQHPRIWPECTRCADCGVDVREELLRGLKRLGGQP